MPKRKRKRSYLEIDHIVKKLRKLERKIGSGRSRQSDYSDVSSSDRDDRSPDNRRQESDVAIEDDGENDIYQPGCSYWNDIPVQLKNCDADAQPNAVSPLSFLHLFDEHEDVAPPSAAQAAPPDAAAAAAHSRAVVPVNPPAASASAAPVPVTASAVAVPVATAPPTSSATSAAQPASTSAVDSITDQSPPALDADLLLILGEDPTSTKEYGNDIQKDLAIRLNHIATSGLSKENGKELKEKYLIPANCKLIKAPTLNPEIRAALVETQAKRDKGIENKQVLTSCALSSLSAAITLLLSSENKNPELLKLLMDTARTLGDIQHADSVLRRFFILSTVKKELKDQLEKTKIDEMLFGNNLAETLKSAKTINKSGADLRSASTTKPASQKSSKTPSRPLNYRATLANRKLPAPGAGGARGTRPAYSAPTPRATTTQAQPSGSRTSSRPSQTRHRR